MLVDDPWADEGKRIVRPVSTHILRKQYYSQKPRGAINCRLKDSSMPLHIKGEVNVQMMNLTGYLVYLLL